MCSLFSGVKTAGWVEWNHERSAVAQENRSNLKSKRLSVEKRVNSWRLYLLTMGFSVHRFPRAFVHAWAAIHWLGAAGAPTMSWEISLALIPYLMTYSYSMYFQIQAENIELALH